MAIKPYNERCKISLDNCAICGKPLPRHGGHKVITRSDGSEAKVCNTHPVPEEDLVNIS